MNLACQLALLPALLLVALPGGAAERLNDSGVAVCRDAALVDSTACAGTGQDGEFGRDVDFPQKGNGRLGFNFVRVCNNGELAGKGSCPAKPILGAGPTQWGCTKDRVTGLTWELKTDDDGPGDKDRLFTNTDLGLPTDASTYAKSVNAVGKCGATNWRVPTRLDLHSLVDHGVPAPGPTIDQNYFPNTVPTAGNPWYITAGIETGADGPHALLWDFSSGLNQFGFLQAPYSLRLVRGKPLGPAVSRWVLLGEEAYDTTTNLVWKRCLITSFWNGSSCTVINPGPPAYSWHVTLGTIKPLSPWRMPSIKELASIVDDRFAPSFDPAVFPPSGLFNSHWSSTPVMGTPAQVWGVEGVSGNVAREGMGASLGSCNSGACLIRLVRDGPP